MKKRDAFSATFDECQPEQKKCLVLFYRIGNFVSYTTKVSGGMRTRAKMQDVASDRARRENVPRHIRFYFA